MSIVAFPQALAFVGWFQPTVAMLSLVTCWAAFRRHAWGFWSLVGLVFVNMVVSLGVYLTAGDASILAPIFLGALGFALLSNRFWYRDRSNR